MGAGAHAYFTDDAFYFSITDLKSLKELRTLSSI